jgi:hypothetical protein
VSELCGAHNRALFLVLSFRTTGNGQIAALFVVDDPVGSFDFEIQEVVSDSGSRCFFHHKVNISFPNDSTFLTDDGATVKDVAGHSKI